MKLLKASEQSRIGYYFLGIVLLAYIFLFFIDPIAMEKALTFAIHVFESVIPVMIFVIVLMTITNYYISVGLVNKHLSKSSGMKRWFIAILGGLISTGPIYMWFPMLREMKDNGVSYGFIACFLYNRAVKPPLIPVMIFYFGLKFTLVLGFVMIFMSIIQGILFEKMEGEFL